MMEKLNELPLIQKLLVALVIAVLLPVGAYYGLVSGMEDDNLRNETALKKKVDENNQLEAFRPRLADLDRQIAALRAQMEQQKLIVPDDKDADKFLLLLQDTATNSGINLRKLESKAAVNKEYYTELPFNLEMDGPYYGMVSYFDKLAGSTRIVNAEGISIKALGANTTFPMNPGDSVAVTATVKTFFAREVVIPTEAPAAKGKAKGKAK